MFTTIWRFPKSWQPQKSSQNVWISWDRRPLPRKRPIHRRCRCLRFPGPNLQMETENLLKRGQNNHKPPMTGNGNHTTYLLWWWLGDGLWHCLPTLLKKRSPLKHLKLASGWKGTILLKPPSSSWFYLLFKGSFLSAEWKEFLGRVTPRPGAGGGDSYCFTKDFGDSVTQSEGNQKTALTVRFGSWDLHQSGSFGPLPKGCHGGQTAAPPNFPIWV